MMQVDIAKRFVALADQVEITTVGDQELTAAAEEVTMPYHVEQGAGDCDGYAVVKDADGEVMGCHDTQEEAEAQVAALYANEADASSEVSAEVASQDGEEWHGVLTVEGEDSGDYPRRQFAEGSIEWRDLPLPLGRATKYSHGGTTVNESEQTGWITRIERIGTEIHGWGHFEDTPQGAQHRQLLAAGRRKLSIDGDNVTIDDVELVMPDGLDPESDEALLTMPEREIYHYARIMGVTDVPFPAYQNTYIESTTGEGALLDDKDEEPEEPVDPDDDEDEDEHFASGMIALVPSAETVSRLSLGPDVGEPDEELHLTLRFLGSDVASLGDDFKQRVLAEAEALRGSGPIEAEAFGTAMFNPAGDEPAVVMLVAGDRVFEVESSFSEDLKAPDSHRFTPHVTLEYPKSERFADSIQEGLSRVGPITFDQVRVAWGDENVFIPLGEEEKDDVLLAAAFPVDPPDEWFDPIELDGPTPLTVTDDGEVYGHLALDGTCHIGVAGTCVTPPAESSFDYFNLASVRTASGKVVATGKLTMRTGHAAKHLVQFAAAEHYDNTGTSAADVVARRDRWGIYVHGAARPDLTDSQVRELRASVISGDWRKFGTGLRLVAALLVNVPGFPVPRTSTFSRRGEQTALVAAGIVTEAAPVKRPPDRWAWANRIAAEVGWDNQSRADQLAKIFEEA